MRCPISYVLPTRDRPDRLARTLDALGRLASHDAEVIVVDNASGEPARAPGTLANGIGVRVLRLGENLGAAARNHGVQASDPGSAWVVMLDDDSHPVDTGFLIALDRAPSDVGAVSADIALAGPDGRAFRREDGGLPEVFVGCGMAIRRGLFLELGGYDPAFGYYAEEYDLAARLLLAGRRVRFSPWFRVLHHKVQAGRDMGVILERLVRNNAWVAQRYAPDAERRERLRETRGRYRAIARKERALDGYARGLLALRRTRRDQRRTPMPPALWDRFTGLAAAREAIDAARRQTPFASAALVDAGKNAWCVRRALEEQGVRLVPEHADPEALVIATLSPGPMLDAFDRRLARLAWAAADAPTVVAPWLAAHEGPSDTLIRALTGGHRAAPTPSPTPSATHAPAPAPPPGLIEPRTSPTTPAPLAPSRIPA